MKEEEEVVAALPLSRYEVFMMLCVDNQLTYCGLALAFRRRTRWIAIKTSYYLVASEFDANHVNSIIRPSD